MLLLSDFLNKLFGILKQMYLFIVCAMTNLVFSHNGIMYVVECSVCLNTDMYQHIKLELFDCCVLVFHRGRKFVSFKNVLHSFHS